MNIVLFSPGELGAPLALSDRRAQHILNVLKRGTGDSFDAGIVNGPRGKATVTAVSEHGIAFRFEPSHGPVAAADITLIVGLPRPQTARDILRDATTLGVAALHFVKTDKGEASYAQSSLWSSGEWMRHRLAGAEQAFETSLPDVTFGRRLAEVLEALATKDVAQPGAIRVALDNYESAIPVSQLAVRPGATIVAAIGSERGWSAEERQLLRTEGFVLAHLGSRVLRTETAVVAALSVLRAKLGLM